MFRSYLFWLALSVSCVRADEGWKAIPVPGSWEASNLPEAKNYDGTAWYRAWVWPHPEFFTPHERNLFEESVSLSLPGTKDACEVFVNGVRIGVNGQFPPQFQPGSPDARRWKVPPGTLKKDQWNCLAIRIHNASGPGGLAGEAPFLMDYFQECVLTGTWEFRTGDDPSWAAAARKEKPAAAAFDSYRESNRLLGESPTPDPGPKLPPAESAARMQAHPEFVSELLLAEPLVAQPTHMSFDSRGRLWVSQYRQYPYPAGATPVSRDKYYRTHYDSVPAAPPHHTKGRDRISVHEDTDSDGNYDKHSVFLDGLNLANAALPGRGGVWVMHTPHLLFYPDKNEDLIPDGPPEVRLSGFGLEDSHSVANGLVWGMDGWLYGAQGSTCSCRIIRPGLDTPDKAAAFEGCMVWRYHPDTKAFEIFAEGSGNTFGLEVDSEGRLFSGHNGGDTRGWHYVQGGFYLKQGVDPGKFGPARYPWTFGDLPMMRSTTPAPRFTHFFAVGEGTALPSSFAGKIFALDPLHNVVIAADRRPAGSTFETADIGPAVKSTDEAFRPVYITNAPDGSLYVADFYDHYIAHGQHYQSQIDATTGRIYRLRGKDAKLERDINLAAKSDAQLVQLLAHPNKWHRQTAVRLLAERRDLYTTTALRKPTTAALRELLKNDAGIASAGALWAGLQGHLLHHLADCLPLLHHPSPVVRIWAVRSIGECTGHPGIGLDPVFDIGPEKSPDTLSWNIIDKLVVIAASEPDAAVRAQLACTARRTQSHRLVLALAMRDEDASDPFIPHLLWYALERALAYRVDKSIPTDGVDRILATLKEPAVWSRPMLQKHLLQKLMRRLVADGSRDYQLAAARLLELSPDNTLARPLLAGFNEAVQGRDLSGIAPELLSALASRGGMSLPLRLRKGEPAALPEALTLIRDPKAPVEDRIFCIRTLSELRVLSAISTIAETASDTTAPIPLRRAALSALTPFDDAGLSHHLLKLLPNAPAEVTSAALTTLVSRPAWCAALLKALQQGHIPTSAIPLEIIETLRLHPDKTIAAAAITLFPASTSGPAQWQKRIAEVEAALKQPGGNPYEGETLFTQRCAGCHKLFFKGGAIGPDLTAYQRDNLGTMLISIINPNAEVREGFVCQIIETKAGQSLTGYILERDANTLRLRGLDGQTTPHPATDVKSITPLGRSLMPEGLLDGLTDAQLRDLFAWLRQSQPISK
jgi:putative membrane-bound dehydrogenase-like protein